MEPYNDMLPIMLSPFGYNPEEWIKHPKLWLDEYILHRKLPKYEIYYKDCEYPDFCGYYAVLVLCDRIFSTPIFYMTTEIARVNVIILTLLNITGYCEIASELQELLQRLLKNTYDVRKLPKSFATKKSEKHRKALSKSLDNYSDEPYISQVDIKEKIVAMLQNYNLNVNHISNGSIMAILAEDYDINVSGRSVKIACNEIRRDTVRVGLRSVI